MTATPKGDDIDLVQHPRVPQLARALAKRVGETRPKLIAPLPNGLVGHNHTALGEEIFDVARFPGVINPIGERVDFEAPEGELAWAGAWEVAGGSVCLFRAVDGMITRHDCVLPIRG